MTAYHLRIPTRIERIGVAAVVALAAFWLVYASALQGSVRTDFSLTWFGANALLHGANPFVLVGPGRVFDSEWAALYPATAYLVGIPFTVFSESLASAVFVSLSAFALAYGATRDSWHHLPMFASVTFMSSAHVAQWSILFTAALFIPWLSVVFPVKPQLGIPILAGIASRKAVVPALVAATLLWCVSLALLPTWPGEWLSLITDSDHLVAPVFRPGGFLLILVLLRWRRPEAWLVAFMATMPQTSYPYNLLPLLAIGSTYRESAFLSIASSIGCLARAYLTDAIGTPTAVAAGDALLIALGYVPSVILVLRRPASAAERGHDAWMARILPSRVSRSHVPESTTRPFSRT